MRAARLFCRRFARRDLRFVPAPRTTPSPTLPHPQAPSPTGTTRVPRPPRHRRPMLHATGRRRRATGIDLIGMETAAYAQGARRQRAGNPPETYALRCVWRWLTNAITQPSLPNYLAAVVPASTWSQPTDCPPSSACNGGASLFGQVSLSAAVAQLWPRGLNEHCDRAFVDGFVYGARHNPSCHFSPIQTGASTGQIEWSELGRVWRNACRRRRPVPRVRSRPTCASPGTDCSTNDADTWLGMWPGPHRRPSPSTTARWPDRRLRHGWGRGVVGSGNRFATWYRPVRHTRPRARRPGSLTTRCPAHQRGAPRSFAPGPANVLPQSWRGCSGL